jgi:hypothetical protein
MYGTLFLPLAGAVAAGVMTRSREEEAVAATAT